MFIGAVGSQMRIGATQQHAPQRRSSAAIDPQTGLLDSVRSTYRGVVQTKAKLEDAVDVLSRFRASGTATSAKAVSGSAIGLGSGEEAAVINTVAALASVTSGSFKINDTSIAVDITTDSLSDLLSAIEASGAGVSASYDSSTDKVTLTGSSADHITPDSNGTALFGALDITEATYVGSEGKETGPRRPVIEAVDEAVQAINGLLTSSDTMSSVRRRLLNRLQSAAERALGTEGPSYSTGFGLTFNFGSGATQPITFDEEHQDDLDAALRARGGQVKQILVDSRSNELDTSIFGAFLEDLKRDERGIANRYASQGLLVNTIA